MIEKFRRCKTRYPKEQQLADLMAFVGRLMDSGLLYPAGTANGAWYLDEDKQNLLCKWNAKMGKRDALANYFLTHKEDIPIFKEIMEQLKTA